MGAQTRRSVFYYSLAAFLLSFHYYLTIYVNSSLAEGLFGNAGVALVFGISAVIGIISFLLAPMLLRTLGGRWLLTLSCGIEGLVLYILATIATPTVLLAALTAHLAVVPVIGFVLDIFFEQITPNSVTGLARGIFLTACNIALVIAPAIAGIITEDFSMSGVYIFAASVLAIFMVFILPGYKTFRDPVYTNVELKNVGTILKSKAGPAMIAQYLLRIFYAWAIIYMPLYLTEVLGFSWSEVGIILSLGLIPFVLLELPLGHIADRFFGEKELLVIGFCILSGSTMLLALPLPASIPLIAGIFFATRVGAAIIEVASETNFFRHTDGESNTSISIFRMAQHVAYVVGLATAVPIIWYTGLAGSFFWFGILLISGVIASLSVKDAK